MPAVSLGATDGPVENSQTSAGNVVRISAQAQANATVSPPAAAIAGPTTRW